FVLYATPTLRTYILSLHDALPIFEGHGFQGPGGVAGGLDGVPEDSATSGGDVRGRPGADQIADHRVPGERADRKPVEHHGADERSEEHTSELQSRENLVCRLLLEK